MLYRPRRAAHHCHVVNDCCVSFFSMSNVKYDATAAIEQRWR
jgi:hypothetical protein